MPRKEPEIPPKLRPDQSDYTFDLDTALLSVIGVRSSVPADAFTAGALGTERDGSGVVIAGGLVLTMGYLVMEAETIWLTTPGGGAVQGHTLGVDAESGFAIVQPLGRLNAPALEFSTTQGPEVGSTAILAAQGGMTRAIETHVVARQEFAGYWEYVLDDAIFTAPAHPFWGGAALIGQDGRLLGVASLILQQGDARGRRVDMNMVVPIARLLPILDDLRTLGRVNRPPRPWLGIYAMEDDDTIVVGGLADGGPAEKAGLMVGDRVLAVGEEEIRELSALWRRVWSAGNAGARVALRIGRLGAEMDIAVTSADRESFLRVPLMH